MHERKQRMFELADAFVALPGGVGTLEEVVEQMTWAQLGRHRKPILLANVKNFWDPLCALLDHMEELQFIRAGLEVNYLVAERVEDILPMLTKASRASPSREKEMKPPVAGRCERAPRPVKELRPSERHRLNLVALEDRARRPHSSRQSTPGAQSHGAPSETPAPLRRAPPRETPHLTTHRRPRSARCACRCRHRPVTSCDVR